MPILPRVVRHDGSFTLVEMLVVIACVAILTALLLAALQGAINKAAQAATASNLRQISTAITFYAGDNDGKLPGPTSVGVFNYGDSTPQPSDPPYLGFYLGKYLGANPYTPNQSIYGTSGYYFLKALTCPGLSAAAQRSNSVANYCMMDQLSPTPHYTFGEVSTTSMAQAQALAIQPKKLMSVSAVEMHTAFLCTADQEVWKSSDAAPLPLHGVFGGQRLWLFLDGSQSLSTNNATWTQ